MSKVSKETASNRQQVEGSAMAWEDLDGWTVEFSSDSVDVDSAFVFKGLPNDQCQASHMGYVIKGKMGIRTADGKEEVYEAGDAYVLKPGHTPISYAGSEVVVFTPTEELNEMMPVITANMRKYMEEHGMQLPS